MTTAVKQTTRHATSKIIHQNITSTPRQLSLSYPYVRQKYIKSKITCTTTHFVLFIQYQPIHPTEKTYIDLQNSLQMCFPCKYCEKSFGSKQQKEQHELIHENKRYTCDVCQREYSNLANLTRHKSRNHPFSQNKSTTTIFSVCDNKFVCGDCGQIFENEARYNYNQHIDEHFDKGDKGTIKYATKK